MEKLKLLNYEGTLLKDMKMKPLSRYYFLNSTNPGEQFFMFTSLCAFCARKMGKDFEQPEEFMDPTVIVSKIMQLLQELVNKNKDTTQNEYFFRINNHLRGKNVCFSGYFNRFSSQQIDARSWFCVSLYFGLLSYASP